MRILHVASFNGNIGDNANHAGFRKNFQSLVKHDIFWEELEIRNFYKSWNKYKFSDYSIIKHMNSFDLIVIGGGNFFEICHDYSSNGTTIDLNLAFFNKMFTPIFFNGLGFDIRRGYTEKTKERFKNFIEHMKKMSNCLVSFRNDGSEIDYINLYGHSPRVDNISIIPDGGFFFKMNEAKCDQIFLGINVACDMLDIRYKNYDGFIKSFTNTIIKLSNKLDLKLKFFAHIYSDLKIINDLISLMPDEFIRYKLSVSQCLITGQGYENYFFDDYKLCKVMIATRLHANICCIANNIPIIGLDTHGAIKKLYTNLSCDEINYYVDVNTPDLENNLYNKVIELLNNSDKVILNYSKLSKVINTDNLNFYKTDLLPWINYNLRCHITKCNGFYLKINQFLKKCETCGHIFDGNTPSVGSGSSVGPDVSLNIDETLERGS